MTKSLRIKAWQLESLHQFMCILIRLDLAQEKDIERLASSKNIFVIYPKDKVKDQYRPWLDKKSKMYAKRNARPR